jgi:hypothetical protein
MSERRKATVEIFRRDTNEVVETKEVEMKSFTFYWDMQANDDDYGWREVEEKVDQEQFDEVVRMVREMETR